jgi:hypothetical protein
VFNLSERISVAKEKRSFFRGELNVDGLLFHQAQPPSLAMRRRADDDEPYAASEVARKFSR